MKILYITRPYKNYSSANYQYDFIRYLEKYCDLDIFLIESNFVERFKDSGSNKGLLNVIQGGSYDVITLGHNLLGDHPTGPIIPPGLEFLSSVDVPKVAIIQKEYARLGEKVKFLNSVGVSNIVSHLYDLKSKISNCFDGNTYFIPFAFDPLVFKLQDQPIKKDFDIFFSGVISNPFWENSGQEFRFDLMNNLFFMCGPIKLIPRIRVKVYWNGFFPNRPFVNSINRYRRLDLNDYHSKISRSKFTLCTNSFGLITPRLFEAMASGSTPIITDAENLKQIPGIADYVVFAHDGEEALDLIKNHPGKDPGALSKYAHRNHSWENRINDFVKILASHVNIK